MGPETPCLDLLFFTGRQYLMNYTCSFVNATYSNMDCFYKNGGIPLTRESVNSHYFDIECQSTATSATTSLQHASNTMHAVVETPSNRVTAIDDGVSSDANISDFLARKVQIATQTWSVGTPYVQILKPWTLFLNNPAVKRKLENYFMIKGDLQITFLINGTPFHAGMLLASYMYMNTPNEVIVIGGDEQSVTRSQRPHLWLNASTNKGGCICVPYFAPTNYLSLTSPKFDSDSIGTINIDSIADLIQINAGTDSVTITVFAELINSKLTVPTMASVALSSSSTLSYSHYFEIQTQSDEYVEEGVISGPSSAIAAYAGMFASAPIIGPFATATQIGASAVSSIARLFGYSRPTMVADISPMRNFPVSSLALTEGVDTSQKLSVTGKQELTIDPSVVGLPSEDTLTLSSMTSRESYLTQFLWETTDLVDTSLFACHINPMAERRSVVAGGFQIIPTSLSYATRPFLGWSGSLRYRFQVIASQYHRGRIAIIYDPNGPLTGDPFNTTFNTIIDLADGRDFSVDFKWQQDVGYMSVDISDTTTFYTEVNPETLSANRNTDNGVFYVRVVNELVVPDGISPVSIIVSISAGPDYELVNPGGDGMFTSFHPPIALSSESASNYSSYFNIETQSAVEETPLEENAPEGEINIINVTTGVMSHIDEKPLIYYGERVLSFRQLIKRYGFVRQLYYSAITPTAAQLTSLIRAMPPDNGFDVNGPDTVIAAPNPSYFMVGKPMINYLKRSHAGWRGSIRWKFLPTLPVQTLSATRASGFDHRDDPSTMELVNAPMHPLSTQSSTAYRGVLNHLASNAGVALTQCNTMDALEVEIPNTVPLRFCSTSIDFYAAATNTYANGYPGGDSINLYTTTVFGTESNVALDTYAAAGEDFTLVGWIGAPVMYTAPLPNT